MLVGGARWKWSESTTNGVGGVVVTSVLHKVFVEVVYDRLINTVCQNN